MFTPLQNNLHVIREALQNGCLDSLKLSGPFSLADKGSLWNQFFITFYESQCKLFGSVPKVEDVLRKILNDSFNEAAQKTYSARQKRIVNHIREIDVHLPSQNNLKERFKEFLIHEGGLPSLGLESFEKQIKKNLTIWEERDIRTTILGFREAAFLFWKMVLKEEAKEKKIDFWLKKDAILHHFHFYKILKKEARWALLEGIIQQNIPIHLLAKLPNINSSEELVLEEWIVGLNDHCSEIEPKLFGKILEELIQIVQIQGESSLTFLKLLLWLEKKGCLILKRADLSHMNWREKLKKGSEITCNGVKLRLGDPLGSKKRNDTHLIFALVDYPKSVVKIAQNRFRLLIEDQRKSEHFGTRYVRNRKLPNKTSGLDQEGSCLVIEKLTLPFRDYIWISDQDKLEDEDETMALTLASHFFCWHDWNEIPEGFDPFHLMFDSKKNLSCTRINKKTNFNYNSLEDHVFKSSKGNIFVLRFLMNVSKLGVHPMAKYYRKAVNYTLKTGKTNLLSHPLPHGFELSEYDTRVEELCKEAEKLRSIAIQDAIEEERKISHVSKADETEIEQKMGVKLAEVYDFFSIPGNLSFLKDAIHNGEISKIEITYSAKYYQMQYDLLIKRNS